MNTAVYDNLPVLLNSQTATIEYLRAVPFQDYRESWGAGLNFGSDFDDDLQPFLSLGARDILNQMGPIPKEDYDYYENL